MSLSWLVKEGEAIKADDPLIEIQTDKSNYSISYLQLMELLKNYL